jgi:hypothetical protein
VKPEKTNYNEVIMNYRIKRRLKENEKDEITEYDNSKIILPKVLLLRDIPT